MTVYTIQKLVYPGWGLTEDNGYKIFVPNTIPGDQVSLSLYKKKKTYAMGKCLEIHQASPDRKAETCPHYHRCGGCQLQDVSYATQLKLKEKMLQESIRQFHPHLEGIVSPMIPCKTTTYYRYDTSTPWRVRCYFTSNERN